MVDSAKVIRMKIEAARRMNMLGMFEPAIAEFEQSGTVYASEPIDGILYELTSDEKRLIDDWQEYTGCIAYAAMRNDTVYGKMLAVLYVSKYENEWADDRMWLEKHTPLAYVFNRSCSLFSEYGSIAIEVGEAGGLIRRG